MQGHNSADRMLLKKFKSEMPLISLPVKHVTKTIIGP